MLFTKKGLEFLARHAERKNGKWLCKQTLAEIRYNPIEQQVEGVVPSDVKTKQIQHPWCPLCTVQQDFPSPGTRVRSSDVAPLGL